MRCSDVYSIFVPHAVLRSSVLEFPSFAVLPVLPVVISGEELRRLAIIQPRNAKAIQYVSERLPSRRSRDACFQDPAGRQCSCSGLVSSVRCLRRTFASLTWSFQTESAPNGFPQIQKTVVSMGQLSFKLVGTISNVFGSTVSAERLID